MTDFSAASHRMPWHRASAGPAAAPDDGSASPADEFADGDAPVGEDGLGDGAVAAPAAEAGDAWVDAETASAWAAQATDPGSRRDLVTGVATHLSAEYAERAGIDIEVERIEQAAESLATRDGRVQAMRELGVHMSSNLAERYGVTDDEAQRLMEGSRKLLTPEGRREVLASQTGDAGELLTYVTTRGSSIEERREVVRDLLANQKVRGTLARAGKGVLIGGVILIIVLVGVLIGAVALLEAVVDSAASASPADPIDATRPVLAWFVGGPPSA